MNIKPAHNHDQYQATELDILVPSESTTENDSKRSGYKRTKYKFPEDRLPYDQPGIETTGLLAFRYYIDMLTDSNRQYPTMGVVLGEPGLGKTTAVTLYLDSLDPRPHTGHTGAIRIRLEAKSTPAYVVKILLESLGETPSRRSRWELADEAVEIINDMDVYLIFVDEADYITTEIFDLLRSIHDKTGCTIVLVGLPSIMNVIRRQKKFESRVAAPLRFPSLDQAEVLERVLPAMVLPRWTYDKDNKEDVDLGGIIWKHTAGSFRTLRNLLQASSQIAVEDGHSRITKEVIMEAVLITKEVRKSDKVEETNSETEPESYEEESETRKNYKEQRKAAAESRKKSKDETNG